MKTELLKLSCITFALHCSIANALTPVDVELQLLIDISGSISSAEYNLQMQGYSNAFMSNTVQNAIVSGSEGKIAVQMIMWSGQNNQQVMIDWTLVDSASSADTLATTIANIARPFSGWTGIGSAINFGFPEFLNNSFIGTKKIIDISGDGTNNSGVQPSVASSNAINAGVDTINGIVITNSQSVIDQYTNDVIAGDTPFLLAPANFQDFQSAIESKIVAEIEGSTPEQAIVQVPEPNSILLFISAIGLLIKRRYNQRGNHHETK